MTKCSSNSIAVDKRHTFSLSPGPLSLCSTTVTPPSSETTVATPCRDQAMREPSNISAISSSSFSPNVFPPLPRQSRSPENLHISIVHPFLSSDGSCHRLTPSRHFNGCIVLHSVCPCDYLKQQTVHCWTELFELISEPFQWQSTTQRNYM